MCGFEILELSLSFQHLTRNKRKKFDTWVEQLFYKGPEVEHFRMCGHNPFVTTTLPIGSHRPYANDEIIAVFQYNVFLLFCNDKLQLSFTWEL